MSEFFILGLIADKRFPLASIIDLQKTVVSYLLLNPSFALNIDEYCEKNTIIKNIMIKNSVMINLVYNNLLLYQFLWIKYISVRLPEYSGVRELKQMYNTTILAYKKYQQLDKVKYIEKYGKYDMIMKNYKSILKTPTTPNYDKIISAIREMTYFDFPSFDDETLLFHFVTKLYENNDTAAKDIIIFLINNGASLNIINKKGETLLNYLCLYGNIDMIKLLIKNSDFNINFRNGEGKTALMVASGKYKSAIVELLIQNGASVNLKDGNYTKFYYHDLTSRIRSEVTALMYAAKTYLKNVIFLVEAGANINDVDMSGDTALHYAVSNNLDTIVKYLIDNGADVNIENNDGDTAKKLAYNKNSQKIIHHFQPNNL